MQIVLTLAKKYWAIIFIAFLVLVMILTKKKKVGVSNKDETASNVLENERIREATSKDYYKSVALQLAENLGTAYGWFDPRRWYEDDKRVYELISELNQKDFNVISALYFEVYAKGRNLSEDLAKNLDSNLYRLLRVK